MARPEQDEPVAADSEVLVTGAAVVDATVDPALAMWERRPPRLSRMDRSCTLALVAAEQALVNAGLDTRTWNGDRASVVVGTAFGCHATNEDYFRGVMEAGVLGASPRLFAYTLPSSPLGEVTIHYGARGPAETLVSGRHAGLEAVGRALALCAAGKADVCIAIAVDVATSTLARLGSICHEGAVAFVVENEAHARNRGARGRARVLSLASAFDPNDARAAGDRAMSLALHTANITESSAALVFSDFSDEDPVSKAAKHARSEGAVPPAESLARWIAITPAPTETAVFIAVDRAGGAAALVARAGD